MDFEKEGTVMKKILVAMSLNQNHREQLEKQTEGHEVSFKFVDSDNITLEDVKDVDCIIGSIKRKWIKAADKLEWLQIIYVGADLFTVPGLLRPETILTNAAGAYNTEVAEHMLAMTFSLVRHFGYYMRNQVKHVWKQLDSVKSVKGAKILVLGLGRIGGDYASKVKALGAYVIGVKRTVRDKPDYVDEIYTIDELDDVIGRADIVAMVLPGVKDTEHIMNSERLNKMKRGAYLINVGRGNAIDLEALKAALKSGQIGGAGLDVTEPEPLPADDELWDFNNVIITPHIAGHLFLDESRDSIVEIVGKNLNNWLNGKPLINVVDRQLGY